MCKKQTSVYHSSTESEVISLDAGLRMDGILALDLWVVVIEVLHSFLKKDEIINPTSSGKPQDTLSLKKIESIISGRVAAKHDFSIVRILAALYFFELFKDALEET